MWSVKKYFNYEGEFQLPKVFEYIRAFPKFYVTN